MIQFSNLNGCGCDDYCTDFNELASTKYAAGFLGFGAKKGELKKTDLFNTKNEPEYMLNDSVCSSKDTKFGFICFKPAKEPTLRKFLNYRDSLGDIPLYYRVQEIVFNVFWDEMILAAGDEYNSDTSSITYEGYKKWRNSAVYSNIPAWKDSETEVLVCEFMNKEKQDQYNQIKYKLKNGAGGTSPNFGKCG